VGAGVGAGKSMPSGSAFFPLLPFVFIFSHRLACPSFCILSSLLYILAAVADLSVVSVERAHTLVSLVLVLVLVLLSFLVASPF
jgi:hypothetical protein